VAPAASPSVLLRTALAASPDLPKVWAMMKARTAK
jgi:hypothetical protein